MSFHYPDKAEDAWPHTQTVLFVIDSDTCFGESIEDLISEVKSCKHLSNDGDHRGSGLSGKGAHFKEDRAEKLDEIIPKSLLFIDVDILEGTKLGTYLEGNSIPKPSYVVILSDGSSVDAERVREKRQSAEIAQSKEDVLNEAEDYFKKICPKCNGERAAKEYVKAWKQAVYQRIYN